MVGQDTATWKTDYNYYSIQALSDKQIKQISKIQKMSLEM